MPITAITELRFLRHGGLLVFAAPRQLLVLTGPEYRRTIPWRTVNLGEQANTRQVEGELQGRSTSTKGAASVGEGSCAER
jgi:hypothetical protein